MKHYGELEIIAANVPSGRDRPREVMHAAGGKFIFAKADKKGTEAYGVRGIPHTVFIDCEGNIAAEHTGSITSEEQMDELLKSIL